MDAKKDPGKFTIRFCMSDPRQRKAADVLNAQGRMKAQFLTNAILNDILISTPQPTQEEIEGMLERIVERILDEHTAADSPMHEKSESSEPFSADGLAAIAGTLQAFRK